MIPFDFDYFLPKTLQEAVSLFQEQDKKGKKPYYYSGGTELITLARLNMAYTEAVIDLKKIPECRAMGFAENVLVVGSSLSLTEIEEANHFPLLTQTASEVADHTSRGKITLGGNIGSKIFYREAVLPFLLADSIAIIAGTEGITARKMGEAFNEKLQLKNGEFLVQLITERKWIDAPFVHIKRRQQWETGYPLVTVAALKGGDGIRLAVSGFCPFPFRSEKMEAALNNEQLGVEERVVAALKVVPEPVLNDVEGSKEYRRFVLKNVLHDILARLGGVGLKA